MNRKAVPGIMVTLLIIGTIGLVLSFQPIKAGLGGEAKLLLETDKWVYALGENVTITLTNIGNETVPFGEWPPWIIYTYPDWEPVYPAVIAFLAWDLDPGGSEIWIWNQYDEYNGTFVGPGTYVVHEHTYNHTAFFAITPLVLEMAVSKNEITVGEQIDITLTLKNIGTSTVTTQYGPPLFDAYYCTPDRCFCWSDGKVFPPIVLSLTLEPGESHTETLQWNLYQFINYTYYPPDPGTYYLWGRCNIWEFVATPPPVAVTIKPVKTLLGTGWGWMRIEANQSACGRARLYQIREEQIELVITCEGKEYSRTWNIISHTEYKYGERYLCYSEEWGFLIVRLHEHRRWQFWYAVGEGVVAFGFQRFGGVMPI